MKSESNENNISSNNVLGRTYDSLVEGLGGIAASEKKEIVLTISHLAQRIRGAGFLRALQLTWEDLRKKAKISDAYIGSDQHLTCLQELLEALDREIVDEKRFNLMKRVFIVAATETKSQRSDILPQQLMRIARQLSSGEIIVLETAYRIGREGNFEKRMSAGEWLKKIAEESGLQFHHLVELHEEQLLKKYLLTVRTHGDRSGVVALPHFRVSDLGVTLCKFIEQFDEVASA